MMRCLYCVLIATLGLAPRAALAETAALRLTARDAVARALEHNLSLQQQSFAPALGQGPEQVARAAFEPELFAEVNGAHTPGQVTTQRAGLAPTSATDIGGQLGVRKTFSTGTSVEVGLSSTAQLGGGVLDPAYQSSVSLTARQSLLQGNSRAANQVAITTARLSRQGAEQQLKQQAEQTAVDVLGAYFDLHDALAQDAIQALAIRNSELTLQDTRALIRAGKLPFSEEVSVRYTLQTQRRAKLQTEQAIAEARDRLARLTGLVTPDSLATPAIVTTDVAPALPSPGDLQRLQAAALQQRGDYLAAQREVELQRAKVRAAKHLLLPKLDLVGSVFASGLSGSASGMESEELQVDEGYWASYKTDKVGWSAGLSLAVPLGNGKAKGELRSAELELRRAETTVKLAQQTIAEELNRAWRAVQLAHDQLALTETAEQVAQTKLQNEQALYKAGKTTAHLLASVQDEVIKEHLAHAQAATDLNKAVAKLHATAGTLLSRMRLAL